jgi:uncharacterized damage-inducible protein DinB
MNETQGILYLFSELYEGDPWIGVNLKNTLAGIDAQLANKKINPYHNSIWEIVEHIISWRANVLERVKGKIMTTPGNNYISPIQDKSERAWQQTLEKLEVSQQDWTAFLKNLSPGDLAKKYQGNQTSNFENIHGIIQHDAYHLGQIILLAKIAAN